MTLHRLRILGMPSPMFCPNPGDVEVTMDAPPSPGDHGTDHADAYSESCYAATQKDAYSPSLVPSYHPDNQLGLEDTPDP